MSAIAVEQVRPTRVAAGRIPMTRVVSVELRKMFDTRSGFWLMASIVIASVLATGAVVLFAPDREITYNTFAAAIGFPMAVILPMIAILSVTSEWSQRSGLTTFTLVPHRGRVIRAKVVSAVTVAVVSMLIAFAVGAIGNLVGTAITGTSLVWDITLTEAAYIVLGNVLGLLIGFMLGVLVRNSAGAIVAYFVYSLLLPTVLGLLAANAALVPGPAAVGGLQLRPGRLVQRRDDRSAVGAPGRRRCPLAGRPARRRARPGDALRGEVAPACAEVREAGPFPRSGLSHVRTRRVQATRSVGVQARELVLGQL